MKLKQKLKANDIKFITVVRIAPFSIIKSRYITTVCDSFEDFLTVCKNAEIIESSENEAICFTSRHAYIYREGWI